jgi:beta-lactam-binding protein with PASTA domain
VVGVLAAAAIPPASQSAGASSTHGPRRVPDVVGLPKGDVYAAMRHAQLYFTTRGPGSTDGSWRSASAQRPRAGTLVAWHATVSITTSRAAGHALRRVPRVAGLSRAQVYAAMRHAQLYFTTRGPGSAQGTWKSATGVAPRAGTLVRWHSSVTVATSLHRRPPARRRPTPTTTVRRTTTTVRRTTTTRPATTTTPAPTTTYPGETTTTSATTTSATTTSEVAPTTLAPTTTLKAKPKPKTKPHRYRIGLATWYSYVPGRCATSYLPFGTRIHVRDLANGRTVTCVVTDRQGRGDGRVVDLSETQFAHLAPLWRGVVRVKVSW